MNYFQYHQIGVGFDQMSDEAGLADFLGTLSPSMESIIQEHRIIGKQKRANQQRKIQKRRRRQFIKNGKRRNKILRQ